MFFIKYISGQIRYLKQKLRMQKHTNPPPAKHVNAPAQAAHQQPKHKEAKKQNKQDQKPKPKQAEEQKQVAPVQPQQFQEPPKKLQIKRVIKLTELINALDEDKKDNKLSLFIDLAGNAFTFFKYKGDVIDLTEFTIKETGGAKREDNLEKARKTMVFALKAGAMLVINCDLFSTDVCEYFKGQAFFNPEKWFNYEKLLDPEYHKKEILHPEEDVDNFGNKGFFTAKKDDFKFCVLYQTKEEIEPEEVLAKLGLVQYKNLFNVTKIVE